LTATPPDAAALLDRVNPDGLSAAEVAEREQRGETNNFKARVGRSYFDIIRANVFNLFTIVLLTLLVVTFLLGDYATVLFAGFSVVTNALLGTIQEIYSKRKLDRMAELATPEVTVMRGGEPVRVSTYKVVKDDVLPLEPGDKIVVDGLVLQSDALEIDESQLTGESDAVLKERGMPVSSGSFCVAGAGVMVATVVGKDSTLNKLSTVAKQYKIVLTPTQRQLSNIVQFSVIIMLLCTPMLFVAGYVDPLQAGVQGDGDLILNVFRNAVVFVASIVPQGLVLTATLSLTIGAITMMRHNTLVQRVNAVENMANCNVLCFDKTGTLTTNELMVQEITPLNGTGPGEIERQLALYLNNLASLNRTAGAVALHINGEDKRPEPAQHKTREIPFNSTRKWSAIVLDDCALIMGAPERVLTEREAGAVKQAAELASSGLRILAFARAPVPNDGASLPADREALALIVLADTVRPNVNETLKAFEDEGVELKVISGDNLETVRQVATSAGMVIRQAYTGAELEQMDDAQFRSALQKANLFARVEPDTKRRIVHTLKELGFYVGMTGDGVNDVPALKEANLAIVMNDGAQISKDVADLVLLNNALSTLPRALHEGRIVKQSIFATSKVFLVKNVYSLLWFIFSGFMGLPFPIDPIQVSWVTFGVINVPATLIAMHLVRPMRMDFWRRDVIDYVLTAGLLAVAGLSVGYGASYLLNGGNFHMSRGVNMMLMTLWGMLVYWNVMGVQLFEVRTWREHRFVFFSGLGLAVITMLAPFIAPQLLSFVPPTLPQVLLIVVVFCIHAVALHVLMRTRAFTSLIWKLTSPP
jgi:cation-transporting ATPase E